MFWVIVAIIIAGLFVASSIKSSAETKARVDIFNNLSDEDKIAYVQAEQEKARTNAKGNLSRKIFELSTKEAKSDLKISQDKNIQSLGFAAGTPIKGVTTIHEIKRSIFFLIINNLAAQYAELIDKGYDDKKIAWELGRRHKVVNGGLMWRTKCYRADDIKAMREDNGLHQALNHYLGKAESNETNEIWEG